MELKPGQHVLQKGDIILVYEQGSTEPHLRFKVVGPNGEFQSLPLHEPEATKGTPAQPPLRRRGPP